MSPCITIIIHYKVQSLIIILSLNPNLYLGFDNFLKIGVKPTFNHCQDILALLLACLSNNHF